MEKCQYLENKTIKQYQKILETAKVDDSTYNENFIMTNIDGVMNKIKLLFKNNTFILEKNLIENIRRFRYYSEEQIDNALTILINDDSNIIVDQFNRQGNVINIGEYYFLNPKNLMKLL